jgi:hypothetical protein
MMSVPAIRQDMAISAQGFTPRGATELMEMAKYVAESSLVPEALRRKPADCFLIMATGMEYGFPVFQALQMLHVIKGKVTLPGETCAALIQAHPECVHFRIWFEGEGEKLTAWVQSGRKGREKNEPISFSMADARQAGLSGDNWKKYPKDMLCWKAVARDKRRNWPDVMPGCTVKEDLEEPAPQSRNVTHQSERGAQDYYIEAEEVKPSEEQERIEAFVAQKSTPEWNARNNNPDPALALLADKKPRSRWECAPRLLAACKDRAKELGGNDRAAVTKYGTMIGDAIEAMYGPLPEITDGDKLEGAIEMAVDFQPERR